MDLWDRPAGAAAARRLDVGRPIRGLWFSPDGTRLVCLMLDGTVETWDLGAGSRVGDVPAAGGRLGLGAAVGDPAGRLVLRRRRRGRPG